MQDNPYYNNISYILLVLDQVIADRPIETVSPLNRKNLSEKQHSSSMILSTVSRSMEIIENDS